MEKVFLKKIISIIIFFLFVLCVALTFYIQGGRVDYKNEIISIAYEQNDRIIQGIAQCANDEINEGKDIKHALYDCGTGHRSMGDTGDFFAVDLISGKILVDNSPDCMKNGEHRSFNESGECFMHLNPTQCREALKDIYNLKDRTWWEFDNSKERLSCAYIPSKSMGYKGPLGLDGVKDKDNVQIAVCIGFQEDELMQEVKLLLTNSSTANNINQFIVIVAMLTSLFAVANLTTDK